MKSKKIIKSGLAVLIMCFVIGFCYYYQRQSIKNLEVIFFDVGQGDSALINYKNKFQMLIDGGADNTIVYKLGEYLPFYDRTIDLIVISHHHDDHLVGLVEVLRRYRVEKILITGIDYYTPAYDAFLKEAARQDIKIEIFAPDWGLSLEDNLAVKIVYPLKSFAGLKFENINNSSIVLKLQYNKINFLFTGDAEFEEEKEIMSAGVDLAADVLKAAHHGSDTSSSNEFLTAVAPQYAVISVGADNKFGHPSLRTVNRLERMAITVLRTDEQGDIKLISDGEEIIIDNK